MLSVFKKPKHHALTSISVFPQIKSVLSVKSVFNPLRITLYHGSPWSQRRKFAIHFTFPSLEHIFCNPLQKGADRKRRLKTPQITQISHNQKPIRVIRKIRVQQTYASRFNMTICVPPNKIRVIREIRVQELSITH